MAQLYKDKAEIIARGREVLEHRKFERRLARIRNPQSRLLVSVLE